MVTTSAWDLSRMERAPGVYPAPGFAADGVSALFYEGEPWCGKPTRIFAWYGVPAGQVPDHLPAMVLVHGGGGTAFAEWVRLWTGRGYAALAMDTCGCVPGGVHNDRPRHPAGGPPGWGGFDSGDQPSTEQWPYHAVAAVIRGHSLLRSFPEIDPARIGVTGISWGGYLACIAAGVDPRLRFAAPVYGCGFLGENPKWFERFAERGGVAAGRRWLAQWDASRFLPAATLPMLWVNGTNDLAYGLDSWRRSYRLPAGPRQLCLRLRMPHAHGGPGENPEEIHAFANQLVRNGPPLPRITGGGRDGRLAWATYAAPRPILKAELNHTADVGDWRERRWRLAPARLDAQRQRVEAEVPADATAHYLNLTDERGLVVSSEHLERGE